MGKPDSNAPDHAVTLLSGSLSAPGVSGTVQLHGTFNFAMWGTWTGLTFAIERSFDGGANWFFVNGGTNWGQFAIICDEPEIGVLYRLNCTAIASGTVNYRLSQ